VKATAAIFMAGATVALAGCVRAQERLPGDALAVESKIIDRFDPQSDATRFGDFEFRGGLEISSPSGEIGGMSAIRMEEDGHGFIGVMDTGNWYRGRLTRDDDGRMTGVENFQIAPILNGAGKPHEEKWQADAEGLAIDGGRLVVGFEHQHRVEIFSRDGFPPGRPTGELPLVMPPQELRRNAGIEMVAIPPDEGPLAGAPVLVSERSINEAGDIFAAVTAGPKKGVFFVRRHAPYDITDGAFLPDGDMLLLERRFSLSDGIGMRIRRIDAAAIEPGRTVDGPVVLEADWGSEIDNMEGLDVVVNDDGGISIILVSDDNHLFLQRNLLLEFELVGN
jgi:hypothetical protein